MNHNSKNHRRRSIRLKDYDYSQAGLYFITICCQGRQHLFGHIHQGIMCLNVFGSIVYQAWLETPSVRPNIVLGACIIMPNHMDGIVEIKTSRSSSKSGTFQSPTQTIGAIVRGYKGTTTKQIRAYTTSTRKGELHSPQSSKEGRIEGRMQFAPTDRIDLTKSIWQRNYYEHIIRTERAFHNISNYIINNPANWETDKLS